MLDVCKYRCPELNACINASLWCDGISHCPSGYDEALSHCSFLLQLPLQYLLAFCAAIISGASFSVFILLRFRRKRRTSAFQRRLESMSSDTAVFGDKEVICWHSDNSVRYVEVDRVTTVWQCFETKHGYSEFVETKISECDCFYTLMSVVSRSQIILSVPNIASILRCLQFTDNWLLREIWQINLMRRLKWFQRFLAPELVQQDT